METCPLLKEIRRLCTEICEKKEESLDFSFELNRHDYKENYHVIGKVKAGFFFFNLSDLKVTRVVTSARQSPSYSCTHEYILGKAILRYSHGNSDSNLKFSSECSYSLTLYKLDKLIEESKGD